MAKERWLDPWRDTFYAHSGTVRDTIKMKDPQKTLQVIQEHLPVMISIRNEVASLPLPSGFGPGLFGTLWHFIVRIKNSELLEIERDVALKNWDESIGTYQRELRRLESGRR